MKFNNGYFGACICVLALLGCGLAGFFASVEKDTRPVTNFDYVADVSGLFSYTDAPEYIDYNPSSNLNGYDGNVIYTPANTVNNYPYAVQVGDTESLSSFTFTNSSNLPNDYGPWNGNNNIRFVWFNDNVSSPINEYLLKDNKATKLSNVLNSMNLSGYQTVSLDISQGTYPVFIFHENWNFAQDYNQSTGYYTGYTTMTDELVYPRMWVDMNRILPTHIDVDITSYICNVYNGTTLLYSDAAENIGFLPWYSWRTSDPMTPIERSTSITFTGTGTTPTTYSYMNPNTGIKATTTDATWTNGYHNNIIDIKVIKNGDNNTWPHTLQFTIGTSTVHTVFTGSGFRVGVNNISPFTDLGNWLGVQIRLNGSDGSVTFTPTNDLNMLSTVEPTDYSVTFENVFTPGLIDSFKVKTIANTSKFQVTGTSVFFNTYNVVMVNPSLNVGDYFPNYDEYRLNLYSFAVYGDSITINNQICPVNRDNSTITFTSNGLTYTKTLSNIYLTYENVTEWIGDTPTEVLHTFLTFANENTKYDMGATVNETVSFSGMWYFTTGLYKAVDGTETYWDWQLDGMFHASAGECLLVFIGIIGAGVIVYSIWGRGKLGYLDWLIIIFAVFLACCLLGF